MNAAHFAMRNWSGARSNGGIAHGWMGWAWVWLQLVGTGLTVDVPRRRDAIRERLRAQPDPDDGCVSHLIGAGAGPVVAALACRIDPAFGPVLHQRLAAWERTIDRASHTDVMLGTAGALLAAAEIDGYVPGSVSAAVLDALFDSAVAGLDQLLDRAADGDAFVGLSHGLAGYLLALASAQHRFGRVAPADTVDAAFDWVAGSRLEGPTADWALWPAHADGDDITMHGWCHGGPGVGLALLCCNRLAPRRNYARVANLALAGTRAMHSAFHNLCCGSVGNAHILLEAYRHTRRRHWLGAAVRVRERIRRQPARLARSFWRGRLGHEYLALRLQHPARLPMPGLGSLSCGELAA